QAAAMAVRAIDWKYALGAELTDTGFDASVLSRGSGGCRGQAAHRFHPRRDLFGRTSWPAMSFPACLRLIW
ncbi:hypothetical protein, partial [Streptomyces kaempferi]